MANHEFRVFFLSPFCSVFCVHRSVENADVPVTHKDPIHAIAYNQNFKQLITCSEGSVRAVLLMHKGYAYCKSVVMQSEIGFMYDVGLRRVFYFFFLRDSRSSFSRILGKK